MDDYGPPADLVGRGCAPCQCVFQQISANSGGVGGEPSSLHSTPLRCDNADMRHLTTILVSLVILVAGCGGSVQEPHFAVGVRGPAVFDKAGIVAAWELIGGRDEELPLEYETGLFENNIGVAPLHPRVH
jgi:hypothetical protein